MRPPKLTLCKEEILLAVSKQVKLNVGSLHAIFRANTLKNINSFGLSLYILYTELEPRVNKQLEVVFQVPIHVIIRVSALS